LDPDGRKKLSAMAASDNEEQKVKSINVRVLRQDGPGQTNYWEEYAVPYEPNMNVISVLQRMAAIATTADGKAVAPIVWRCNCLEEVCGSCTMVINGRVRQACSALIDKLLEERPEGIELRPMSKFPVVRDLMVDRDRLFRALKKSQSLDSRGRVLRHRPRTSTIARDPGAIVPVEQMHELRVLPGSLSSIRAGRCDSTTRRK
jgi:succinate dehydrogenase/fumarate reductase-like Fe-S protein